MWYICQYYCKNIQIKINDKVVIINIYYFFKMLHDILKNNNNKLFDTLNIIFYYII